MPVPRLAQFAHIVATLLVLIASVRIIATYKVLSNTTDEPAHLAAGMEWLQGGTYTYEDQHPPLARVLGATGLYLAGSRWGHDPEMYNEGFHLLGYGHHYARNLFYSRLAMLPLFWIACAVVFLGSRRLAGPACAILATLIFTTVPAVLGPAGLVTTDMALTAFTGAATLCAVYWAERPDWMRSVAFGLLTALAVLSKFSALLFLPPALLALYGVHLAQTRPSFGTALREIRIRILPALLSVAVSAGAIEAAYRFSFGSVPLLHLRFPAPAFFNGIYAVWEHNREGHPAWLLGTLSQHGFWYYYPVVAAVKTPLALLMLTAAGLILIPRRVAVPLAFSVAIAIVASFGSINIGIRHILPVYLGLSVCGGIVAVHLWQRLGRAGQGIAVLLLAWQLVSGARQHPDYIAYTNELAGDRPDRILADSDLDWSQDMKRLADRMYQLGVPEFTFKISTPGYLAAGNNFPRFVQMPDGDHPRPGWNAVSITPWRIFGQPRWPEHIAPTERIGHSILLYYFPE